MEDAEGRRIAALRGCWDEGLWVTWPADPAHPEVCLWHANEAPREPRYHMTPWAAQLNEMTPGLKEKLAPTDSRLRPDQRALEDGAFDEVRGATFLAVVLGNPRRRKGTGSVMQANREKQRLEHKQRAARKAAERGQTIEPRWFRAVTASVDNPTPSPHPGGLTYRFTDEYWAARERQDFAGLRDIFGANIS